MRYEWDEAKNLRNQGKHDAISFELPTPVFEDERCLIYADRIEYPVAADSIRSGWQLYSRRRDLHLP